MNKVAIQLQQKVAKQCDCRVTVGTNDCDTEAGCVDETSTVGSDVATSVQFDPATVAVVAVCSNAAFSVVSSARKDSG